ncbi:MAG: 50S ribosomal protein L15 [Candidatus Schekmanbacteria bacterium RBG_16_38_11]|uniref:Large ribosomal subunit protein uL15 n=1 Tax=Candidatus Schekmanbacteria bacterium RBG_16_38_11 TaxID=1817880 RepID=A0A1F7RSV5_9BACT|nr:ribosomal protein L15 [uncultured bacterium]OGL44178.1 MAG: 50S ribosomal protein L15 [Candidatus Schekmanbacteria bacterium RBG_16_38_11]
MELSKLPGSYGKKRKVKRVGRGPGSGHGKTSGKGHKGQKARSGGQVHRGFEGGQMPLQRRLPKRGFHNIFRKEFAVINLKDLEKYEASKEVTPVLLLEDGKISKIKDGLKILGEGDLSKPLKIYAHKFSQEALKKIEKAGGKAVVLE